MKYLKFILQILFFSSFIFYNLVFVNSVNVQININETSSLTKLLSGKYSIDAIGTLEIYNPSNFSRVFEFTIPLSLDSFIGISKIPIDISSSKFEFKYNKITGYYIEPNETIKTKYRIFGLLSEDINNITNSKNLSIFEYYTKPIQLSSNVKIFLQKPQREGFEFSLNGSLKNKPGPNSSRLISAGIKNPTDFLFFGKELDIYKTTVSDPFFKNGTLIKTLTNFTIEPFTNEIVDLFDITSTDYSVYWITSNFIMNYTQSSTYDHKFAYELKQISNGGGGGGSGYRFKENTTFPGGLVFDSVLIKKSVDKTVVKNGDEVKVYLKIINVNNFEIRNLKVLDSIPKGYEIKDVSTSVKISDRKLSFKISKISNYETFVIYYTLKNKDSLRGITYLKPAELVFNKKSIFSEGVLLINDLLPEKKVFVQKNIEYIDKDYAKVTIKVQNLGSVNIENLLISDEIDPNALIKDISKLFYKRGSWKIKSLGPGGLWEVSYLIERSANLDSLPSVYGMDKNNVYGSLISAEEITTLYNEPPKTIEKIGMAFAVGLLIFYLLF